MGGRAAKKFTGRGLIRDEDTDVAHDAVEAWVLGGIVEERAIGQVIPPHAAHQMNVVGDLLRDAAADRQLEVVFRAACWDRFAAKPEAKARLAIERPRAVVENVTTAESFGAGGAERSEVVPGDTVDRVISPIAGDGEVE